MGEHSDNKPGTSYQAEARKSADSLNSGLEAETRQGVVRPDLSPETEMHEDAADPDASVEAGMKVGAVGPVAGSEPDPLQRVRASHEVERGEGAEGPEAGHEAEPGEDTHGPQVSHEVEPSEDADHPDASVPGRGLQAKARDNPDADLETEARQAADSIRNQYQRLLVETGRDFVHWKDRLDHGQFSEFVRRTGISMSTAQRMMNVWRHIGPDKYVTVKHFQDGTIYTLAAPSTPKAVRELIFDRAESLTDDEARGLIREAKLADEDSVAKQLKTGSGAPAQETVGGEMSADKLSLGALNEGSVMEVRNGEVDAARHEAAAMPPLAAKRSPGMAASDVRIREASIESSRVRAKKILVDAAEAVEAAIALLAGDPDLRTLLDDDVERLRLKATVYIEDSFDQTVQSDQPCDASATRG